MSEARTEETVCGGPLPPGMQPIPNRNIPIGMLTKRELFAAMAMQGIFAHGYTMPNESAEAAELAVRAADCLLKELAK